MRSTMCLCLMAALLTACSASLPLSSAPTPAPRQPITIQFHLVDEAPDSERPVLVNARTGEQVHLINPPVLDQADITEAKLQPDSATGMYNVQLDFSVPGSQKLADTTARNVGKRLAIVVDRQLSWRPRSRLR